MFYIFCHGNRVVELVQEKKNRLWSHEIKEEIYDCLKHAKYPSIIVASSASTQTYLTNE